MNNITRTTAPVIKATVFLGLAALLVAGCASKKSNSAATSSAPATTAAAAGSSAPRAAATSAAATSAAAVAPAAASGAAVGGTAAAAPGPAAVDVKTGPLGAYLTDATGHTLYLFTPDTSSTSTCYGQCVAYWPPLLTSSAPQAGSGATASLLGTTKRTDGTMQVTYKNHPLYFFKGDKSAGDMTGQGTEGTWFLVSPAGKQIGSAPAPKAPAPKASSTKPAAATPSAPSASASKSSAAAGGGWS